MYLHEMGDDNACFTKDDMQQGYVVIFDTKIRIIDTNENFEE